MSLPPGLALTALLLSALSSAGNQTESDPSVSMPRGWRGFPHVASTPIMPGNPLSEQFGGLHEIYANEQAAAILRGGGSVYPDGSVLVLDLHQAEEAGSVFGTGPRRLLAVMVRNTSKYAATGGWGYQAWADGDPSRPQVSDMAGQCATCHNQAQATGSVFTRWR